MIAIKTMDAMNFAVVGCGMLARSQHIPNLLANPRAQLVLCCDAAEQALSICREQFGVQRTSVDWRAAVADPDVQVIVLATTERLRLPVIITAAEAGKAVYVEKPLASSLTEMREIQEVVHRTGIPFCVGHNRRSSPAMLDAHRWFRSHMQSPAPNPWRWDREGPENRPRQPDDGVAAMSVRINDDWWSWKRWVFDKQHAPHGPMLFEMTHFTDLCNWFLAAEPEEVVAVESGMLNHAVIIRYRTGEIATITMSANGTFGYPKELYEVMGNGGIVVIDHMVEVRTAGISGAPSRTSYSLVGAPHRKLDAAGTTGWFAERERSCRQAVETNDCSLSALCADADKGHAAALTRFIDEIAGIGPPVCGVDDAVRATRMAFAAVRSAREHRLVKMEEINA